MASKPSRFNEYYFKKGEELSVNKVVFISYYVNKFPKLGVITNYSAEKNEYTVSFSLEIKDTKKVKSFIRFENGKKASLKENGLSPFVIGSYSANNDIRPLNHMDGIYNTTVTDDDIFKLDNQPQLNLLRLILYNKDSEDINPELKTVCSLGWKFIPKGVNRIEIIGLSLGLKNLNLYIIPDLPIIYETGYKEKKYEWVFYDSIGIPPKIVNISDSTIYLLFPQFSESSKYKVSKIGNRYGKEIKIIRIDNNLHNGMIKFKGEYPQFQYIKPTFAITKEAITILDAIHELQN